MSKDFPLFSKQVRANFDGFERNLSNGYDVFIVNTEPDDLWDYYISSFPTDSNPMFRERTEHDCSCCKNFIRYVAGMVQIIDGEILTVWENCSSLPYPYNIVGDAMNEYVRSFAIRNFYRTAQYSYGAEKTPELLDNGTVRTWHHFSAKMPRGIVRTDVAEFQGEMNIRAQVFRRGLEEIKPAAIETIIELIQNNNLYRGQEHSAAVSNFALMQNAYRQLNSPEARDIFIWGNVKKLGVRFRNTVIGTLAVDLSEGHMDVEDAVKAFETKVAPANYKRPKSLITASMVKDAEKTLNKLGMADSIHRRFAKISDITLNNVLWAAWTTQSKMKDSFISDILSSETLKKEAPIPKNIPELLTEEFISILLPELTSLEMLVDSQHLNNFVSLTAPLHEDTKHLFKWDNDFAWSYDGDITDSFIQTRVKNAGGRVQGAKMRVSLAWFNTDDLDIHIREPDGNVINYTNKCGKLDVDMNISAESTEPVENISWMQRPKDGTYDVMINNFTQRNSHQIGFDLEVESNNQIQTFNYPKIVQSKNTITVLKILVKNGIIDNIIKAPDIIQTTGPKGSEKWGVMTKQFTRVQAVLLSPNHWDGQEIGNLHTFFILEGCFNPEPTRGIYNEFLSNALDKHRKVFEVLGSKTKCPIPKNQEDQLSGLGFSSTKRADIVIRAKQNDTTRYFKLVF